MLLLRRADDKRGFAEAAHAAVRRLREGDGVCAHPLPRLQLVGRSAVGGGHFGEARETSIGDNVFIGTHSIVLMGSHIGANSIVGAGSVVSGAWPEGSVIAGNPARLVCTLDEFAAKREQRELSSAVEYAATFKARRGSWPSAEQMTNAFAWLYLPHTEEALHEHAGLFRLNGVDPEVLKRAFLASKPRFASYQEFLDYCAQDGRED